MRRTIRKTFLLEGENVTMKYVKQLCGVERYNRIIEDAKKKFFAAARHICPNLVRKESKICRC